MFAHLRKRGAVGGLPLWRVWPGNNSIWCSGRCIGAKERGAWVAANVLIIAAAVAYAVWM